MGFSSMTTQQLTTICKNFEIEIKEGLREYELLEKVKEGMYDYKDEIKDIVYNLKITDSYEGFNAKKTTQNMMETMTLKVLKELRIHHNVRKVNMDKVKELTKEYIKY